MKTALALVLTALLCLGAGCVDQPPSLQQKVPVLLYHHLLTEEENRLYRENGSVISTDEFEWQMKWLHDNGWQTVSSRELIDFLYEGKALPKKSVLITFDDGYASNLRYAAPVLRQYGYTAVIFVSGTLLAQQPPLGWGRAADDGSRKHARLHGRI